MAYNTVKEHSITLIDFNAFNSLSWFVGYYFIVIVFTKLFLNRYLDSLSKKNYMMFLEASTIMPEASKMIVNDCELFGDFGPVLVFW